MGRKLVLISIMAILLTSLLGVAFKVEKVQAAGTIYIRADGSVDPPTANITSADNVTYTFTDNNYDEIVVERNNIVVDGAGYTLQGSGSGNGFDCSGINNVTIQNTNIKNFHHGIWLYLSSNSSISGNNITNNRYGIWLEYSSNNSISGNTFTNDGLYVSGSYQNSVENNTVNGRPLVYLEGVSNYTVDDAGQVILVRCENIRVESLDLSRTCVGVELWETSNSSISGNNITANNFYGVWLGYSFNNSIIGNNITANNFYGVWLYYSSNNSISGNNITADNWYGVWLYSSSNNSISGNTIANNDDGVRLDSSNYNSISGNNITNNDYGVLLDSSNYNSISGNNITSNNFSGVGLSYSSNNSIIGNNIANNDGGIWLYSSSSNRGFHNNLVNNTNQLYSINSVNIWDDGYPSGGNFWSNYTGVDTDLDGIGDIPLIIDANNTDYYPLMGMFSDFNATLECNVQSVSNSTISGFHYNGTAISFDVTGENGTSGFCRICIPRALMNETYRVFVNGTEILPSPELLPFSNSTHSFLYFTYDLSTKEVVIIPEFPSLIILPLFMITCLAVSLVRKRLHRA